ncbi:hypothetical protein CTM97_20495 [Photobacterium phosphoreum]|uniref:Uncharacterized protein n=1 Tax=Photobacterium phosphoreum TaxID=659 RepID=A0A2T3JVY8_PHOPO|nr:hypothetical protein [Photobacterium phosphoreum]PSU26849.1 hypothetical protein CTM96_04595 [Photobacterium phosphoreum]PSU37385.1 hypothetical protein CTM97_20495 [Photobacterium phosphoreum]PSU53492.1 hypothetical protein C9J18_03495 [Photobacterium phosphoreum]
MKKRYLALGFIVISLSTLALADERITTDTGIWEDCGPAKVDAIRIEHGVIFALLNNPTDHWKVWKRIALNKIMPSKMSEKLSDGALLAEYSSSPDLKKLKLKDNLSFNTETQIAQYQSLLENALLHNKTVTIRFSSTESCKVDNWSSNIEMLQLNK